MDPVVGMEVSIRDTIMKWLVMFYCRWWLLVVPVAIAIPASIASALYLPGGYIAHALLVLEETAELNPLDPTDPRLAQGADRVSDKVQSIRAVLLSDAVLGRVVDHQLTVSGETLTAKERAYALRALQNRLSVSLVGDSLLRFELEGGEPGGLGDELQQVLGSFLEALMFPASSNSSTIAEAALRERLSTIQSELGRLNEQSASLPDAPEKAEQRLKELRAEAEKLSAEPADAGTEARSARLSQEIANLTLAIEAGKAIVGRKERLFAEELTIQSRLRRVAVDAARSIKSSTLLRAPHRLVVIDPPKDPSIRSKSRLPWAVFGTAGGILLGLFFMALTETFHPIHSDQRRLAAVKNRFLMRLAARLLGTDRAHADPPEAAVPGAAEHSWPPDGPRADAAGRPDPHLGSVPGAAPSDVAYAEDARQAFSAAAHSPGDAHSPGAEHHPGDEHRPGVEGEAAAAGEPAPRRFGKAPLRRFFRTSAVIILGIFFASFSLVPLSHGGDAVQLPAKTLSPTPPAISGRSIRVAQGADLQAAIDN